MSVGKKEKINVLSLFDGMSCGRIALERAGIKVNNYFASEIDKHAIKVTQHNYPNTIQIGDVTKVKVKLLCLSEVYSYICSYDSNLQSNISEWEVLYWLNKDFTLSAKIRTQKPNERQEVSEPSTVQRIKEVWFSNREMGSVRKFGDYTRSRRDGEENDIRTPQQLQRGKWWYDNDIYRRYKEENIGITIGKTKNGYSEKKNFGNIEGEVFKRRESESCFRENEKSNVEKRCSGELFERKREDRFSREVDKEKGNRRTKEGNFIDEVIRELCRWDESDGITQDYWGLLRLHKEEQITVVEYEEGFYMFKGRVDLCIGGSPCQGFSFAGKQLAFDDPRSKLFFEFVRIWREIKEINPNAKFLLENVRMKKEHEKVISDYLGLEPMFICSSLFSAQQRKRLYWSNINTIETMFGIKTHFDLPDDKGLKLIDILENKQDGQIAVEISKQKRHGKHILESSFNNKSNSLTTFEHNSMVGIFPVSEDFYLDDDNIKKAKNYKGARTFKTGNSRGAMPFPNKLNWKSLCLTTTNGSSRTVNFVDDGFGVRRLTPLEWERLQTVPDNEIICIFELCLDQVKNYVNAVEQNHKLLKLALNAEKTELNEFVKFVIQNTLQNNQLTKFIAQVNVGMQTKMQTEQCTSINQKENNTTVNNAENIVMCKNQNQEEGFVVPSVFINITEGRITHFGKEELHQKGNRSTIQKNGGLPLKMFGNEIMELVKDVDAGMKRSNDMSSISTILSVLSINSLEQMLVTYYLFAKSVITGFTQTTTNQKSISVQFKINDGYTSLVSKSHRYKMLGNGWTVSVISHIFSFLKEGKIFSNFSNENV